MLYNEEYILSLIRNLHEDLAFVQSRLATLTSILTNINTGAIYHGNGSPVDIGLIPTEPLKPALYIHDVSRIIYEWIVGTGWQ